MVKHQKVFLFKTPFGQYVKDINSDDRYTHDFCFAKPFVIKEGAEAFAQKNEYTVEANALVMKRLN